MAAYVRLGVASGGMKREGDCGGAEGQPGGGEHVAEAGAGRQPAQRGPSGLGRLVPRPAMVCHEGDTLNKEHGDG
jgi:hypothetical protein